MSFTVHLHQRATQLTSEFKAQGYRVTIEGNDFDGHDSDFTKICSAIKSVMQTADLDLAQEIADRICHSELVRLGYDNPSVPFVSVSMVAL